MTQHAYPANNSRDFIAANLELLLQFGKCFRGLCPCWDLVQEHICAGRAPKTAIAVDSVRNKSE
jgi:hypothetical protein